MQSCAIIMSVLSECRDVCLHISKITCPYFTNLTLRQSRPNKAGLKCPYVRAYVRPSTKSFFDFSEICMRIEVDE